MKFLFIEHQKRKLVVYWALLGALYNLELFFESVGVKSLVVLESFSGRNNLLELPVFGVSNSLPYILKESKILITSILG